MISDPRLPSSGLVGSALNRVKYAYRPSTRSAHHTHIRTYLSFTIFMSLPVEPSVHSLLAFLAFLHINSISYKVLLNYMSSLKTAGKKYGWNLAPFDQHLIASYLRSISINSNFANTPRGIFDLTTLSAISRACEILQDPPLFRAAFLVAFFAFLPMSNIAPHYTFKFDTNKHILRQDILFLPPGAHILLKWTKTLQESSAHHFVQIPTLSNTNLCPV